MQYQEFLSQLDKKLKSYFLKHKNHICCKCGCSKCCEKGDYPLSQLELEYLMIGFATLKDETKRIIQKNISNMQQGGKCPFLVDSKCSIYDYRPIVCRVHGLAYIYKKNMVKVPFCANEGKNYANVYCDGTISLAPIEENLDTPNLLKNFHYGEIRNLAEWLEKPLTK